MNQVRALLGLAALGALAWGVAAPAAAEDLRVSVGRLPLYAESPDEGILIDVLRAVDRAYSGGRFEIRVFPMERSIRRVGVGEADLHFPTIGRNVWGRESGPHEDRLRRRGLRRSTCSLTKTHFALYRNRADAPLDLARLARYRIETDAGHRVLFEVPMAGSSNLAGSVRKLAAGRIDGLVFAAREVEWMARRAGVDNIARQDFRVFGSKFILPDTPRGARTDALVCRLIARMVRSGTLAEAARDYSAYFEREFGAPYLPAPGDLPQ